MEHRTPHILPRIFYIPVGKLLYRLLWVFFPNQFPRDY